MVTINHHATALARDLRKDVEFLVAGGPLPTLVPETFLDLFDCVVLNEGEKTFLELVTKYLASEPWKETRGIAFATEGGELRRTEPRELSKDLDAIPFPARDMYPNRAYMRYWRTYHGYTATSEITTRGCPYSCDFCSNPVFGIGYRERSAENVVREMKDIENLGYDRVFFADDCFTQNMRRVERICDLIMKEEIGLEWMCLSRIDGLKADLARRMRKAGCVRIFFGIESGNERMLQVMNKKIELKEVHPAVSAARRAGIQTGGFFIIGYPGETNSSLLDTLRFSSRLPLDYLSYSFPYPIIGTGLYTKVQKRIVRPEWRKQRGSAGRHDLLFATNFTQTKLRFASKKGIVQHLLRKHGPLGNAAAEVLERITDRLLTVVP
jgi:anaerobic magnesium-protoporphyrin IX monomethyl ester cyclase